ncbi:MAG: flagellar hook-basal body complex protein FliE [Armatimonadetes bacterium]|nr:flagellar hook-basal body complex protein FliE [Armatimonadota bacterium]
MRIQGLNPTSLPGLTQKPGSIGNDEDFAGTLMDVLREVNQSQLNAAEKLTDFQTGRNADIADVKIALEQASLALNLTQQVRNKVLEAYQEISRMQV